MGHVGYPIDRSGWILHYGRWGVPLLSRGEVEPEQPTYPPMFSDFSILGLKKVSEGGEIPDIQFDWLGADGGSTLSFIKEMLNKLYLLSNN